MFKPMFEEDGYKPVQRKYVSPTHDRRHPADDRLSHRNGRAIKDAGKSDCYVREAGTSVVYGRRGESMKTPRKSLMGLRDSMATSSKVCRFVNANGHADRRLDAPVVCLTPPKPRRRRSR